MLHLLVDLCQYHSYYAPWDQNVPQPRVTSWKQRNKDVDFICGENDLGEQSRATMALLFLLKSILLSENFDHSKILSFGEGLTNLSKKNFEKIVGQGECAVLRETTSSSMAAS